MNGTLGMNDTLIANGTDSVNDTLTTEEESPVTLNTDLGASVENGQSP